MINLLRHFRAANALCRAPRAAAAPLALLADSRQPTADSRRPAARRGISLLEVLISMFVLLFGLMGVAAIFPVGNHYAGKGEQFDRGSALAEAAFADLKARGMLKPELWYYASHPAGNAQITPPANSPPTPPVPSPVLRPSPASDFNVPAGSANGPGYAFVVDPMGTALGLAANPMITAGLDYFPYIDLSNAASTDGVVNSDMPSAWQAPGANPGLVGERWPLRRISLQQSAGTLLTPQVAETIFRLHDDVTNELPKENDRPGIQRWTADLNGYTQEEPWNHKLLARSYTGKYSWLATVVPTSTDSLLALQPIDSRFGSDLYEVSVAVFHDRESLPPSAAAERTISAQMLQGNELIIYDANVDNVDAAADGIRPGNWIAVAGVHPTNSSGQFLLKWYRILSIDEETADDGTLPNPYRRLMLDGPDWPMPASAGGVANDLRAILLPGVISVATQMLPMEAAQ